MWERPSGGGGEAAPRPYVAGCPAYLARLGGSVANAVSVVQSVWEVGAGVALVGYGGGPTAPALVAALATRGQLVRGRASVATIARGAAIATGGVIVVVHGVGVGVTALQSAERMLMASAPPGSGGAEGGGPGTPPSITVGRPIEISVGGTKTKIRVDVEPDSGSIHIQAGRGQASRVRLPIDPSEPFGSQIPRWLERALSRGQRQALIKYLAEAAKKLEELR